MRNTIFFLLLLILLLLWNIIFYFLNEEYRFFVQKIKYQNEYVSSSNIVLDDSPITNSEKQEILEVVDFKIWDESISVTALEFLESISSSWDTSNIDNRTQELMVSEELLVIGELLSEYPLEDISPNEYLFGITPEYPDPYIEWFSSGLTLYSFPTKTFRNVFDIFDVLAYELPISLNTVNNFWTQSFFINMEKGWEDDYVRIVFEYQNKVFWLKIKNLHYNEVRDALSVIR